MRRNNGNKDWLIDWTPRGLARMRCWLNAFCRNLNYAQGKRTLHSIWKLVTNADHRKWRQMHISAVPPLQSLYWAVYVDLPAVQYCLVFRGDLPVPIHKEMINITPNCSSKETPDQQSMPRYDFTSCHAAVRKPFFDRFRMDRTSIVFRSKAIVWGVSLLCFDQQCEVFLEMCGHPILELREM